MTREIAEQGCTCAYMAPCTFCTEMTEAEADVFFSEGQKGLIEHINQRDEQETE